MKDTKETCLICFTDYLAANTKDHQCPDTFCGACGEQYDPTTEQDENGFHLSEICGANDDLYSAILEDISHVIAKHLPHFDNNITAEIWKLLEQFTEKTITQLTDPALNCECGYKH